jgi:hypothetical protein
VEGVLGDALRVGDAALEVAGARQPVERLELDEQVEQPGGRGTWPGAARFRGAAAAQSQEEPAPIQPRVK